MKRSISTPIRNTVLLLAAVAVFPPLAFAQASVQDHLVIILDASGSMRERMRSGNLTRMQTAKQALLAVLQQVPETTQVGLLVFSASNLSTDWVYPLGPLDRAKLEAAIREPEPGGGTPLGAYLKKGADALLEQRQKHSGYGTYRLLVVTDGEATDRALVDAYLPDILTRGILIDVIGVDMRSDHALATRVHKYRRANSPEDLQAALKEVISELRGPSTRDDVAGAEALAALQSIPDELAAAMIQALAASSANNPIGTRDESLPPLTPIVPQSSPTPAAGEGGVVTWIVVGLVALVLLAVVLAGKMQQRGKL